MKRPRRTKVSYENLTIIGVPKKFHHSTLEDFEVDDDPESLGSVKSFFAEYLKDLPKVFEENRGILLFGSNGVGKTFLASLVVKEAYMCRYTARRSTFVEYMTAYTRMWNPSSSSEKDALEEELYQKYKAVEFLVLEELGKEVDSKAAAPILEDLLRYREDRGLVTIICTNLKTKIILERYGDSVFSLMKGNMTPILIEGKDKREEYFNKEW